MGTSLKAIRTQKIKKIVSSITRPANATQYTALDAVSDATADAHHTFTNPLDASQNTGEIVAARCISDNPAGTSPDFALWLFHTDVAVTADNVPATFTDAEALTSIGVLEFDTADWQVNAANAACTITPRLPFVLARVGDGTIDTIYGQLVERGTYTPASGEVITVELLIASY